MRKLVAFGEIMLRLSPENGHRLFQNDVMRTCFGGSEANVAALCAQLGIPSSFVTKLPQNELGDGAARHLSGLGVDTSLIVRGGERLGVYYYEKAPASAPQNVFTTAQARLLPAPTSPTTTQIRSFRTQRLSICPA